MMDYNFCYFSYDLHDSNFYAKSKITISFFSLPQTTVVRTEVYYNLYSTAETEEASVEISIDLDSDYFVSQPDKFGSFFPDSRRQVVVYSKHYDRRGHRTKK